MITDTIGLPEEKVRDLLRIAIQTELKYNATLDDDEDEIDFQKSIWAKQRVVCENCGASLVANLGQTLTCDYCGAPLKVRRFRELF